MKRLALAFSVMTIATQMAQADIGNLRIEQVATDVASPSWPSSFEEKFCRGEIVAFEDPGIECDHFNPTGQNADRNTTDQHGAPIPAKFRTVAACKKIRDAIESKGVAGFFDLAHAYPETVIECVNTPALKAW